MPEQTASGERLQDSLRVLEDRSIPYLTRVDGYKTALSTLTSGELAPDASVQELLKILAYDLMHDTKHSSSILKLLTAVLTKIQRNQYPVFPELLSTMTGVMNILFKTAPLYNVDLIKSQCMEVFLSYPDETFAALGMSRRTDFISLVSEYLENSQIEESSKGMMLNVLLKMLKVLTDEERVELVKEGLSCWFSLLVPLIYVTGNSALRSNALNIMDVIILDLKNIDYENNSQWTHLLKQLSATDKWPVILKAMLMTGDAEWHRAWNCMIKLLGFNLHKSASLINAMLAVLESAFKMSTANRCKAFQCWKVLIENFALNMNQFFTIKRIKLLLIPLKVNNAKDELSATAKFDTWWFLIQLLQPKIEQYLDMLFMPFLNFCFGQVKTGNENQTPPIIPGLTFPKVQCLAIEAIVEIFGHSEDCACVYENISKLREPIMDSKILKSYCSNFMHALKEATVLLSSMNSKYVKSANCCWRSLMRHIATVEACNIQVIMKELLKTASQLVEISQENTQLAGVMFEAIFPSLFVEKSRLFTSADKNSRSALVHLMTLLICPVFRKFYGTSNNSSATKLQTYTDAVVSHGLYKWFLQELSTDEAYLVWWTSLAHSVVDLKCQMKDDDAKDMLIWPITKMEYFTDVQRAADCWSHLYNFVSRSYHGKSSFHLDILQILVLHYKNTPIANTFASRVMPLTIKSILEQDSGKVGGLEKELSILAELSEKDYDDESIVNMTAQSLSVVINALENSSDVVVAEYALTAVNNILKHMLSPEVKEKDLNGESILHLLIPIQKLFSIDSYIKLTIQLVDSLSECARYKISSVREVSRTIISTILRKSNKTQTLLLSTLKNALSESQNLDKITEHPKYEDINLSPINVVSVTKLVSDTRTPSKTKINDEKAQTNKFNTPKTKTTPRSNSKIVKKVTEGDEEFVVVKSNWKFNPNKLTEHQKDMLKKKREDIPALYQDLSQSQDDIQIKTWKMPGYKSDSQDISSSSSKSFDKSSIDGATKISEDSIHPELCPNSIKTITESAGNIAAISNENENGANAMSPSNKPTITKKTSLQSPRLSLKDRINKNMMSLLNNKSEIRETTKPTIINEILVTPEKSKKPTITAMFSAPSKMDSERPSRMKRKPKKFEGEFEVPELIKKRRNSIDVVAKPIENKGKSNNLQIDKESQSELLDVDVTICSQELEPGEVQKDLTEPTGKERIRDVNIIAKSNDVSIIDKEIRNEDVSKNYNSLLNETTKSSNKSTEVTLMNVEKNKTPLKPKNKDVDVSKSSSKKKNRLEVQLAIDTVEGHPLLTSKEDRRATRKSRLISESTPCKSNSIERAKSKTKLTEQTPVKDEKKHNKENNASSDKRECEGPAVSCNTIQVTGTDSEEPTLIARDVISSCIELPHSEDFIESSQESAMSTISIRSSRRSINKQIKKSSEASGNSGSESDSARSLILTPETIKNEEAKSTNKEETPKNEHEITFSNEETASSNKETNPSNKENKCTNEQFISVNENVPAIIVIKDDEMNKDIEFDVNKTVALSEDTVAEMDTEPMDTIDLCSDDGVVINDAEAPITVVTEIVSTYSEIVTAEADTEVMDTQTEEDIVNLVGNLKETDILEKSQKWLTEESGTSKRLDISLYESEINENISPNTTLSSPFKDTIERNKEFLNNTLEISPIKVLSPRGPSPQSLSENSNDYVVVTLSPVKSNGDPVDKCNSPEIFTNDKISPDKILEIFRNEKISPDRRSDSLTSDKISPEKRDHQSPPRGASTSNMGSPSSLSLKKNRPQVRQTGRGAQMLGMCIPDKLQSSGNCEKELEPQEGKRSTSIITPARRNLRMFYACSADKDPKSNGENERFLNFTKEVPSASSSPSGPILKRKLADIADDSIVSPASKRKRVSFHDPPVSTTVSVQKYIEGYFLRSPQHSQKKQERQQRPLIAKSLVKKLENEYKIDAAQTVVPKEININNDLELSPQGLSPESSDDPQETIPAKTLEVLNTSESVVPTTEETQMETQMSSMGETPIAEIIDHNQLNDTDPIFPDLIDCTDSISNIASELSSESMKDLLVTELAGTIESVGDLAKLTELEVNRLCVKAPKVETVRKVLSSYTRQPVVEKVTVEVTMDAEIQTEFEEEYFWATLQDRSSKEVIDACLDNKSDFVEEFTNSISKEAKQKMTEDLPTIVIGEILCDRLANDEETENILSEVAQKVPEQFLDQIFKQFSVEQISEKLGLENIEEYLLKKLSAGGLVKFCSSILQKRIPSD